MNVGFIGLGNMGSQMAKRLLEAGHKLKVHNRTLERARLLTEQGATLASTPREAAEGAEVLITMLADDNAVEETMASALPGLAPGAIHCSMSTIGVACVERLAKSHELARVQLVGAPVFGRPPAAAAGQLFIVTGGSREEVARCTPLFQAMSQKIFPMGDDPRQAHLTKLLGNFMLLSTIETLAEAIALARKSGLDAQIFLETMTGTLFSAPVYKNYGTMIVEEKYQSSTGFAMPLALKDISLALQAADSVSTPLPIASLVRDHLLMAIGRGATKLDMSALGLFAAENAGLSKRNQRIGES